MIGIMCIVGLVIFVLVCDYLRPERTNQSTFSHHGWCDGMNGDEGIALLLDYIAATEYWQLDPHDAKERSAYLTKIKDKHP